MKRLADRSKLTERLVKQTKLHSLKYLQRYKYGFEVPKNYKDAEPLDRKNGNHDWIDANKLEHKQLTEYNVIKDEGQFAGYRIPCGYQLIRAHTIVDVKVNGRHKARVVADIYLSATPVESVYSGVVLLRDLRTCLFICELDGIEPWATNNENAYLNAITSKKVCIRAEPEFGPNLEGHLLIFYKALYELRLSGKVFGQMVQEYLLKLGFVPSFAEASICMRKCPTADHYEYVATYIDDLAGITKDPPAFIDQLEAAPHNFKLKGSGPLNIHLGCEFNSGDTRTLCVDPGKYIDQMEEAYVQHFGVKPNKKYNEWNLYVWSDRR